VKKKQAAQKAPGESYVGKGYGRRKVIRVTLSELLTSEKHKGTGFDRFARVAEGWAKEMLERAGLPAEQGYYRLPDGKRLPPEEIREKVFALNRMQMGKKVKSSEIPDGFGDRMAVVKTSGFREFESDEWRAAALKAGRPMSELVFPSTLFTPMGPTGVRRDFNYVLKKAKMRRIRFHDCRHTYASLLLGKGESLAYVRDQMGHSSIQITVDIYGHLVPGSNRQAVNRLDDPEWRNERDRTGNRLATGLLGEAVGNA